jgi:hypothetical protein
MAAIAFAHTGGDPEIVVTVSLFLAILTFVELTAIAELRRLAHKVNARFQRDLDQYLTAEMAKALVFTDDAAARSEPVAALIAEVAALDSPRPVSPLVQDGFIPATPQAASLPTHHRQAFSGEAAGEAARDRWVEDAPPSPSPVSPLVESKGAESEEDAAREESLRLLRSLEEELAVRLESALAMRQQAVTESAPPTFLLDADRPKSDDGAAAHAPHDPRANPPPESSLPFSFIPARYAPHIF